MSTTTNLFLNRATVTLTNAQIIAFPSTVYELIPAAPSGYRNKLIGLTISYSCVAATYSGIDTGNATLKVYWGASNVWAAVAIVNDSTTTPAMDYLTRMLAGSVHDGTIDMPVPYLETDGDQWMAVNSQVDTGQIPAGRGVALNVAMENNGSTSDLGGGDPLNYMRFHCYYVVEQC